MRGLQIGLIAVGALYGQSAFAAPKLSTEAIMAKVEEQTAFGFSTGQAEVEMLLLPKGAKKPTPRTLDAKAMKVDKKGNRRVLIRFKKPRDVKGMSVLTVENSGREGDTYLYSPGLTDKAKRIVGSDKQEAFAGSDFSYGDMDRGYLKGAKNVRHEDKLVDGEACYHIEVQPQGKSAYYKRVDMFIRKKDFLTQETRYYDRRGQRVKVFKLVGVGKSPKGPVATKSKMWTEKTGHTTFLLVKQLDVDESKLKRVDFEVSKLTSP